ncbi:hypothetical protein KIPB_004894 [Kipferlia bialata]|uniref:Uncharacterized protein n=1 Tax=Kipferlia bialata TaxID=797122 RepID=A0A9K3CUQ7_9EUKA|nr:hypothetical protein KIPB_004894 [Kipferlia bialata]|eukprot:g4894.t1
MHSVLYVLLTVGVVWAKPNPRALVQLLRERTAELDILRSEYASLKGNHTSTVTKTKRDQLLLTRHSHETRTIKDQLASVQKARDATLAEVDSLRSQLLAKDTQTHRLTKELEETQHSYRVLEAQVATYRKYAKEDGGQASSGDCERCTMLMQEVALLNARLGELERELERGH